MPQVGTRTGRLLQDNSRQGYAGISVFRMEGYLVKRAMKSGRNWKKRYFILDPAERTLKYFKKQGDSNIRGVIPISSSTTVRQSSIHVHGLEVKSTNIALYAYASTSEEQLQWVNAIQQTIDRAKSRTSSAPEGNSSSSNNSTNDTSTFSQMYTFGVSGTTFEVTRNYELIKPIGQGAYGVVISHWTRAMGKKLRSKRSRKRLRT